MAINPNISLAVRGVELQDPLAQYSKFAAIQGAQQQNQLAQMQMQEYERTRAEEEGLRNYLSSANLTDPAARQGLMKYGKTGFAYGAALSAQDKAALEQEETRGKIAKAKTETEASTFDLQNKKLNFVLQSVGNSSTPQDAISYINKGVKEGYISMAQGTAEIQQLQNMQPAEFAQYKVGHLVRTLGALDQLNQSKQTTKDTDFGSFIQRQTYDAQGRPIGAPERLPKTPSFSDVTAQGNLSLAQQKFAFEQANPGITVQQTEDGTLVGVNNRTGVAMPITLGGAAPMAPAAAPVSNQFSPRVAPSAAPAVTQAIPGMRSVLDQTAPVAPMATGVPAAPMAGTPLRGKGTAMTQEQQKSAMFGASMLQAQNVIQDVASRGTYKAAVVPGVLEGLVRLAPLGIGDAAANAVESAFRSDPTGLVGPNVDQQKLAQAQVAFATSYLRSTSGAAFGPSEVANTIKEFFPLRGEGDAVIKQKEAARNRAVEGMAMGANTAGRAYMDKYRTPSATDVITNPQFPGFSIKKRG
jgi:YD repeat-containing protein